MIFKPSKLFPCTCSSEGITVTPLSDEEDISEGEVLASEDKRFKNCEGSPFIQLSFWEFGHPKSGRWSWWWRLRIAWFVFKNKGPWPDMVILSAAHAKNLANHIFYIIGKVQKEMKQAKKQPPLVKEEPHAMLCVQHGGSARGVIMNKKNGFTCPKCFTKGEGEIDDME